METRTITKDQPQHPSPRTSRGSQADLTWWAIFSYPAASSSRLRQGFSKLVEETRPLWTTYLAQGGHQRGFRYPRPVGKTHQSQMGASLRPVPKCGWVKFRITRQFKDIEIASSARITLEHSGRWFVSFTRPAPELEHKATGAVVGIDMGVTHTVATSKGKFLDMPELLTKGEWKRKRRLQRKLARQVKGPNGYNATRLAIAKLSAKESDLRKDWIERTTTNLVRNYDLIALEALKIKNMTKSAKGTKDNPGKNVAQKSGLNRAILEQGWGIFGQRLTDKTTNATAPVEVISINPAYTSMRCHECGYTDKKNR